MSYGSGLDAGMDPGFRSSSGGSYGNDPSSYGAQRSGSQYNSQYQAQSQYSGSNLSAKGRGFSAEVTRILQNKEFLVIWLVPWAVFLFTMLFCTYLFLQQRILCISLSIVFFVVSVGLVISRPGWWGFPIGFSCILAVLFGTFFGIYNYNTYAVFPIFYGRSREYSNVVPSQSSSAVADAGYIVFSDQSHVDETKAVSFVSEEGITYCAAPVVDGTPSSVVNFWAAGIGCCGQSGSFQCDDSRDSSAHSGAVIFDNDSWFGLGRYDYYEKARAKAEATHRLSSVSHPIFVRFVTANNLHFLRNHYQTSAIICWVVCALVYLCVQGMMAFSLLRARPGVMRRGKA